MRQFKIGIIILLTGISVYFLYLNTNLEDTQNTFPQVVDVTLGKEVEITNSNLHTFTHPRYGFSLTYPQELVVERIKEGNASETIIFEESIDNADVKSFQVFVTPYAGKVITPDRIKKDIPNGDVREQVEVIIGNGIRAMAFKSSVSVIGETREIWFIHNGFIYEFTTALEFDAWLSAILSTLKFKN